MHQNILELYRKAQTDSLDAQDVTWLETQVRENPYFSMAYMVLARHHFANKSTIKDRALRKSATYAHDRLLLREYLQDTLPRPRKATPIKLEKASPAPVDVQEPTEVSAVPTVETETGPEDAQAEARTQAEARPPEPEDTGSDASPEPAEEKSADPATKPIAEAGEDTAPESKTEPKPSDSDGINWYVNMRLKLQTEKYAGRLEKLRAETAAHQAQIASTASPEAAAEPPKAEEKQRVKAESNVDPSPPATENGNPAAAESTAEPETIAEPVAKPVAETVSEDSSGYEIGSFSSFSFMEASEVGDSEESEIDSMMPLSEAVEIETTDNGPGQITFEEKDRIVEVTVSPEELAKYFKGRLPVELNFAPVESIDEAVEENKTPEFSGPLNEEPLAETENNRKKRTADIISKFIEEEPTISRVGSVEIPEGDLASKSEPEEDEWVTETLGQIYAKQGNKARARQIYEKLALRFPEKSNYFADLIKKL